MIVFEIIKFLGLVILFAIIGFCLVISTKYLTWFPCRQCTYCQHRMEYKGLKEHQDESHYLFHCPHCGAWEEIPKEKFLRDCDEDCKPFND